MNELVQTQLQRGQSEFKSECLFLTCSIATNMVKSLIITFQLLYYNAVPFWPTTEQFRIQSFHSFSSTATSSATSEYGTVPEWPSRNEDRRSGNEERTRRTSSSSPVLPQAKRCKLKCSLKHEIMILSDYSYLN